MEQGEKAGDGHVAMAGAGPVSLGDVLSLPAEDGARGGGDGQGSGRGGRGAGKKRIGDKGKGNPLKRNPQVGKKMERYKRGADVDTKVGRLREYACMRVVCVCVRASVCVCVCARATACMCVCVRLYACVCSAIICCACTYVRGAGAAYVYMSGGCPCVTGSWITQPGCRPSLREWPTRN